MTPEHSKKVEIKIETLCKQGCSQVNQIINNAKNGNIAAELSEFTQSEVNHIIDELSNIMSVYNEDENSDNGSDNRS